MGREKRSITDSWPRERKAVFNYPHSREANGGTSNGKSQEEKTAAELQGSRGDQTIEKGVSTTMKIYRAVEPIAKAVLTNRRRTK